MKIKKYLKPLFRIGRRLYYFGNNRYCPVCKKQSRKFAPYGLKQRPDAQCIHCGSLERHRMVWLYLEKRTVFFDACGKKMLHIDPEPCFEKRFSQALGEGYVTADLNNPRVKVKLDITDIPFDDRSFDIVYCSHVLEHVPDDRKALREFYRVLSDEGWAVLLVPVDVEKTFEDPTVTDPKERERLFGQDDHVRKYGPDFIDRVREAGFHVKMVLPADFLSEDQIANCNTSRHTPIYYCTKK